MAEGQLGAAEQAAVEQHVDRCAECRELLATLGRAVDVPTGDTTPQTLARGDSVGRYVVLDRLGAGGMGIVYSAFDPGLARRVALKLLRDEVLGSVDGEEAHARLVREAQALARLNHPNVLTVYEVATWGGQVYLALEFVDGADLRGWLTTQRSAEAILDVFLQAGEGLAAAHRAGLVHRDFKPGNVLIGTDGRPRVADFGLAQLAGERAPIPQTVFPSPSESDLTRPSVVMGTPGYMAPEQVHGGVVDARTDQFAFCVALYEALCGHRPFARGHDRDPLQRMSHEGGPMAPPPGTMPARVWTAVQRGLQLDPARRFASMDALLQVLAPRKKGRTAWGIAALAAIAVGATVGIGAFARGDVEPSAAQLEHVDAVVARARAAAEAERYLYPPPDDPQAATAYRAVLSLERIDDESRDVAAREARGLRDEFAGRLVKLGADVWDRPGGRAYALDLYAIALVFDPENAVARERAALTPGELALLRSKAAELEFTEAELVNAEPLIALAEPDAKERETRLRTVVRKRARKANLQKLLASWSPPDSGGNEGDGDLKDPFAGDRPAEASESSESSESSEEKNTPSGLRPVALPDVPVETLPGGTPSPERAGPLVKKGRAAIRRGDLGSASTFYSQALAHDARNHAALFGLSVVAFERGQYDRAIRLGKKAVGRAPRRGAYRIHLGDALFADVRYREAKAQYEKARSLGSRTAKGRLERVNKMLGS